MHLWKQCSRTRNSVHKAFSHSMFLKGVWPMDFSGSNIYVGGNTLFSLDDAQDPLRVDIFNGGFVFG